MQLLGRELAISREKEEASVITGLFSQIGSDNAVFFNEVFKDEFNDLDAAIAGVEELSKPFFDAAVKRAIDLLTDYGIGTFDDNSLIVYLKSQGFFSFWDESLQRFVDKKDSIDREIQAAGDGKQAAGEAAKAKVLDLMEGYLSKAMRYTISGFASALMSIITKECGLSFSAPTAEEIAKSKDIYNNVISGKTPEKDRVDAVFEAITLDPNNADAFYFLVLRFGDSDGEIEKAGEHLGNPIAGKKIDGIVSYQKKALKQQLAGYAAMDDAEYIKALEALKAGFSNIKHNMGISPDLITQSEKNIEEALIQCRDGERIKGAEAEILCREREEKKAPGKKAPIKAEPVNDKPVNAAVELGADFESKADPEPEKEPEPVLQEESEGTIEHLPHVGRSKLTISGSGNLLSEDKLHKIRDLCSKFKAEAAIPGLYEPTRKLLHYLELEEGEEIFLGQDKTILSSGKDGFAITNLGIICVSGKEAYETPYSELVTVKNIHWANPDFKFDIMADGSTLIKCLPSEKDDILELVTSIRRVLTS
ncbi:MAG: hypothetical protein E7307_11560 [Butyrivibrio sp.]|nr:hypothetical protein [Butyrivibrio sp.]